MSTGKGRAPIIESSKQINETQRKPQSLNRKLRLQAPTIETKLYSYLY